ncbi:MAG: hypothetical protein KDA83_16320 [Planctomycetales bacterium]|nr:hypothetical protein [Planctomycetales bacterium]
MQLWNPRLVPMFLWGLGISLLLFSSPCPAQENSATLEGEQPSESAVDVYLLSGQSNMQGSGRVADLPASWLEPIESVRFWNGTDFEVLTPSVTRSAARVEQFGPEVGFAREMAELAPERTIYLIKFFRSGQPLHHGWNGNQWAGPDPGPGRANFYPGLDADDPNQGRHYRDMMTVAQAAWRHLEQQGLEPRLRGIVWMQGEQDSKHEQSAGEYAASLAQFKQRTEQDLHSDSVPFVFGQVLPHSPPLPRFTHRDLIRAQQQAVDMRSGAPESTVGCWMVSTDGMPLLNDTVHYDARGQAMLGQAFALGMLQAQGMLDAQASQAESNPPNP